MRIVKKFVKWYLYITTGILLVTTVIFSSYDLEALPKATLWQILLSGFLTTGVTVLFHVEECDESKKYWIKYILHYVALCVVMIVCGNWFGWLDLSIPGVLMMLAAVAAVYVLSASAYYLIDVKQAEEINKKLKEKYGNE